MNNNNLNKVHEIIQDLWADSFGEFAKCKDCGEIISKKEYFEGKYSNIKDKTIKEIMNLLNITEDDIECVHCNGKAEVLFGEEYVEHLEYISTKNNFININLNNQNGEIVGFVEGYTDNFENIYEEELKLRYEHIGYEHLKQEIFDILGEIPDEFYLFGGVGILPKHKTYKSFFYLLKEFTEKLNIGNHVPTVAEVEKGHVMEKIIKACGGIKLNYDQAKIINTHKNWHSTLYIIPCFEKNAKELFSKKIIDFIKYIKNYDNI